MTSQVLIYVVDDDPSIGLALTAFLRSEGYTARRFSSPTAFLAAFDPEVPGCVVTDLVMPEMSGLELQRALATRDYSPPIVFLTGRGDIKATAQAMKRPGCGLSV
jgi:FixJ family two-component response regulator